MLVEDDNALRKLTREILEQAGYKVLEAPDPVSAKELSAATPGSIDLLLTDVVMPKGSGHQLAQDVERSRPRVKVLLMSGHTGESLKNSWRQANTNLAVVEKPFSRSSLLTAVRSALRT